MINIFNSFNLVNRTFEIKRTLIIETRFEYENSLHKWQKF